MRRMLHSLPIRFLLVFALLCAQLGALTHGISHTLEETAQDQSLPHDKHCDLCAAYAQVGNAVDSSTVHFDFAAPFKLALTTHSASFRSIAFTAFAARAPPASV
jgi:hypothetical protein